MPRSPASAFEIPGYDRKPLPCALHAEDDHSTVAVVFPGAAHDGHRLGGSPARPDLHYTRAVLLAAGVAVFEVWWDAGTAPEDDLEGWLDGNVDAALAAAKAERDLGFVAGRSLGSMALARLVARETWAAEAVPTIWLAPLSREPSVASALAALRSPALVVGGTEDRGFDLEQVPALRAAGVDVLVLDGANHGLELDRDPPGSVRLLAEIAEHMAGFVRTQRLRRA